MMLRNSEGSENILNVVKLFMWSRVK